ncbi:MAG: manganese efflux pump [bacterium]|nr:manganese efflux pump [bacterium]
MALAEDDRNKELGNSRPKGEALFALHEALDQSGALLGPLLVAWMISLSGYRLAFAVLAVPGLLALATIWRDHAMHALVSDAIKIGAFIVPLALDTLALAIALGLRAVRPLRPALVCAIFEGTMPAIGMVIARVLSSRYIDFAVYLGAVILITVGVHAWREAAENEDEAERVSFDTLPSMVIAGFAISIDELAVGFPVGAAGLPVATTLAAIAVQAFIVAYFGVLFGRRIGQRAARAAGVGAGVAFILLGLWLIVEHLRLA